MIIELSMDLFVAREVLAGMRQREKLLHQKGSQAKTLRQKADELEDIIRLASDEKTIREQPEKVLKIKEGSGF